MKLIILDRDGVINQDSDAYIKSPEEWLPIPGSLEAIAALSKAGYKIVIATNQSGLGRGLFAPIVLEAIHTKMQQAVEALGGKISKIVFCPHTPADHCSCRKPKPGLLHQIAEFFNVSLVSVPFIGDTLKDVVAARAVGCQPILVRTGKGEKTLEQHAKELADVLIFADLKAAVTYLLERSQ